MLAPPAEAPSGLPIYGLPHPPCVFKPYTVRLMSFLVTKRPRIGRFVNLTLTLLFAWPMSRRMITGIASVRIVGL